MDFIEWSIRMAFYFWLGVGGIAATDLAMNLHDVTAAAYRHGPISTSKFTRMLTSEVTSKNGRKR